MSGRTDNGEFCACIVSTPMGDAYTPGLTVTRNAVVRKHRRLPLAGEVVVEVGATVKASDVIARTELPGKVTLLNVATKLGVLAEELAPLLVIKPGDPVREGDVIARNTTFWIFTSTVTSPVTGVLESVSAVTGMAILREPPQPVEVHAYMDGVVVEVLPNEGVVIETRGALVQGIFGLAGERQAPIVMVAKDREQVLEAAQLTAAHAGKIVVGGARATLAALRRAIDLEVAAIVCGGFAYQDVRELLGYDVGVAVTGNEDLATTLVVTEGFGDIAMARATFELLASLEGKQASVNGATQIRAGVIRPEVIVPGDAGITEQIPVHGLEVGAPVRVIRAPHFGKIGTVISLPVELAVMPTETKARVVVVEVAGEMLILPRANVEVIER
jgi:hypothetical protein